MRNKIKSLPVVLNTQKPTDASLFTTKKRLQASRDFEYNSNFVGTLAPTGSDINGITGVKSNLKQTGRPRDASDFTAYRGSQGIGDDSAYRRGKIVQTCSANCIPSTPVASKSASTITSEIKNCHTEAEGIPKFVDNTIRLIGANIASQTCCVTTANHNLAKDIPSLNRHPNYNGKFRGIPYYPAPI
jgi:hypothetical protein